MTKKKTAKKKEPAMNPKERRGTSMSGVDIEKCKLSMQILDLLPTPVMAIDKEFNVTFMNSAGAQAVGSTPEEVKGKKCYSLFNTEHCNTPDCQVAKAMQQNGIFTNDTVAKLPSGDLPIRYTGAPIKDTDGNIIGGLEYVIDISGERQAVTEVQQLAGDILAGHLDAKGNPDGYQIMGYKNLIRGINDLIDAFVAPINVTAEYVDRISKGDIPEKITDEYKGDFNEVKNNLNALIDALNGLIAEAETMKQAAAEGELDTRADVSSYHGAWATIVQGLNDTAEGMAVPMKDIGRVLDKLAAGDSKTQVNADYKGDYNVLKVACNELGHQINLLGREMEKLADAAAEGDLDYRGDSSKFKGDIAEVVNGVNRTMDGVVTPIMETIDVLEAAANKDLTKQVVGDYRGRYDQLKQYLNTAIKNLGEALMQAASASDQVGSASAQVASASQSLAEGAAEQAASLEETSSSLEEMSSMTKQNADNAAQANNLMQEANQSVDQAKGSMAEVTTSMEEISKASEETQKIIKTIDEIAFQTNLLALNAAVEAARAGEAGAGFAVVADEVRNLAMRAADAAKNTAGLIEDTVKKVNAGSQLVTKTNEAFVEVAGAAAKVSDLVGEISAASNEQAQGIEQVNTAVAEMDKVVQQNAANSEESASAAEEMSAQAQELQSMLATFKLTGQEARKQQVTAAAPMSHQGPAPKTVVHHSKATSKLNAKDRKSAPPDPKAVIPMDGDKPSAGEAEFKDF
ncbi:MAG: PAS domain-containing protein [Deltaproteobacteria bacterium]|nr:PAS domain-containing protein [Deltaproteobacteria bacterium]